MALVEGSVDALLRPAHLVLNLDAPLLGIEELEKARQAGLCITFGMFIWHEGGFDEWTGGSRPGRRYGPAQGEPPAQGREGDGMNKLMVVLVAYALMALVLWGVALAVASSMSKVGGDGADDWGSALLTQTSVELAELTGKEHKNVLADIRRMLVEIQLA